MSQLSTGLSRQEKRRTARTITSSASLPPLVVSPQRACELLDASMTRIYGLMRNGELESFQSGRSRKITVASIQGYIDRRIAEAAGEWHPGPHSSQGRKPAFTHINQNSIEGK
jgi:hypothetical protein